MSDAAPTSALRRLFRRLAFIFVIPAILVAAAVLSWPHLMATAVEHTFDELGARAVSVGAVEFDPFTGRGRLSDLRVNGPGGEDTHLSDAKFDLDLRALFTRRVLVKSVTLRDADVEVETAGGKTLIGGFDFAADRKTQDDEKPWGIGIGRLDARAIGIAYQDGERPVRKLRVERFEITDFATWNADASSTVVFDGKFRNGRLKLSGKVSPLAATRRADVAIDLRTMALGDLLTLVGEADVDRYAGTVSGKFRVDAKLDRDGNLSVTADGTSEARDLSVRDGRNSFAADRLGWTGKLGVKSDRAGEGFSLDVEGGISGGALEAMAGGVRPVDQISIDTFRFDDLRAQARLSPKSALQLDVSGKLSVGDMHGTGPGAEFDAAAIEWSGSFQRRPKPGSDAEMIVAGEGQSGATRITLSDTPSEGRLVVSQRGSTWRGDVALVENSDGDVQPARVTGAFGGDGIAVEAPALGWRVFQLGRLDVRNVTVVPGTPAKAGSIEIQDVAAMQHLTGTATDGPPVVALKRLEVEQAEAAGQAHLSAKSVRMDGAEVRLRRRENGEIELAGPFRSLEKLLGDIFPANGGPAATFGIASASIANGHLVLEDLAVKPNVRVVAAPLNVWMTDIDSSKPEKDSPINVKASLGRYGEIDWKGRVRPFAPKLTLGGTGRMQSVELPSLSPYLSENFGYELKNGRLDASVKLAITEGQLKADSELVLSKLQIAITDADKSAAVEKEIQVPLETALSLLRDSDNIIRLKVPVSGNIGDPRFDVSDAVNQAVGNAIKKTMFTVVKVAFPIVGLVSMIDFAGQTKMRFNPVGFDPASAVLGADEDSRHLAAVAKLLHARPAVKLTLCGVASEPDRDVLRRRAIERAAAQAREAAKKQQKAGAAPDAVKPAVVTDEQLLQLAEARARAVKDRLVDGYDIAQDRLFLCRPDIDKAPDSGPRVDILL